VEFVCATFSTLIAVNGDDLTPVRVGL